KELSVHTEARRKHPPPAGSFMNGRHPPQVIQQQITSQVDIELFEQRQLLNRFHLEHRRHQVGQDPQGKVGLQELAEKRIRSGVGEQSPEQLQQFVLPGLVIDDGFRRVEV